MRSLSLVALFTLLDSGLAAASDYAPVSTSCPSTPLVRAANGISSAEATWIAQRKATADAALANWLQKTNPSYADLADLPAIGLTSSGGGLRALLTAAGVVQALDGRESNYSVGGLYQALTYQTGLSGGAWMLGSLAGNNYPTISQLQRELWTEAFEKPLFFPEHFDAEFPAIAQDLKDKAASGFPPTLVDAYGRLLAYQLLQGNDGGVADTLSGIGELSNFTAHAVPFPILTAINLDTSSGSCKPSAGAAVMEMSPLEWGSFDTGIDGFIQTTYLGSTNTSSCVSNFDNLGLILGTSSNVLNELCLPSLSPGVVQHIPIIGPVLANLTRVIAQDHKLTYADEYASFPNPFTHLPSSEQSDTLSLVDGGETKLNNPILPLLQPERNMSVLFVSDSSADRDNFPDGTELFDVYQATLNGSMQAGLAGRMPEIPNPDIFVAQGLNKRGTFFGCGVNDTNSTNSSSSSNTNENENENDTGSVLLELPHPPSHSQHNSTTNTTTTAPVLIIYLPNNEYTFASNEPTFKLQYSASDSAGMIDNGAHVGAGGNDNNDEWGKCVACAIASRSEVSLPGECTACFDKYCYN